MIAFMDHGGQGGMGLISQDSKKPMFRYCRTRFKHSRLFLSCMIVTFAIYTFEDCSLFHLIQVSLPFYCFSYSSHVSQRACSMRMRCSCLPDLSSSDENGALKLFPGWPDYNARRHANRNRPMA